MSLLSTLQQTKRSFELPPSAMRVDMSRVGTIILGGGQGTRLFPLTATRCKPAVPFGGKYRLIDIPVSNAIHSGCQHIYIVTQFLATSLQKHVSRTYRPGTFSNGYVELLPAEQGPNNKTWFQGTADAVRQNLEHLEEIAADYILILSGDQLYNMNFQHMLHFAKETDADLIIAALTVNEANAKRMGLLKINEDRFITAFHEKPQERHELDHMRLPEFTLKQLKNSDPKKQYLGSMGIYLFKRQALINLLKEDTREDFGKHLIPTKVQTGTVAAYLFDGYWEDIGTIDSFYHANLALTEANPPFDCYSEFAPIFSHSSALPAAKFSNTRLDQSIVCEGSIIQADEIIHSIIGPRSVIKSGTIIRHSYLIGNDAYASPARHNKQPEVAQIGENCIIERAIIDKQARIGNGVRLVNMQQLMNYNSEQVYIRDGIIVVPGGAHIPDGFVL